MAKLQPTEMALEKGSEGRRVLAANWSVLSRVCGAKAVQEARAPCARSPCHTYTWLPRELAAINGTASTDPRCSGSGQPLALQGNKGAHRLDSLNRKCDNSYMYRVFIMSLVLQGGLYYPNP